MCVWLTSRSYMSFFRLLLLLVIGRVPIFLWAQRMFGVSSPLAFDIGILARVPTWRLLQPGLHHALEHPRWCLWTLWGNIWQTPFFYILWWSKSLPCIFLVALHSLGRGILTTQSHICSVLASSWATCLRCHLGSSRSMCANNAYWDLVKLWFIGTCQYGDRGLWCRFRSSGGIVRVALSRREM